MRVKHNILPVNGDRTNGQDGREAKRHDGGPTDEFQIGQSFYIYYVLEILMF